MSASSWCCPLLLLLLVRPFSLKLFQRLYNSPTRFNFVIMAPKRRARRSARKGKKKAARKTKRKSKRKAAKKAGKKKSTKKKRKAAKKASASA